MLRGLVGVEQIVAAVAEDAQIDRQRINSMREQSALRSGEVGSAVEFWFWALAVKAWTSACGET